MPQTPAPIAPRPGGSTTSLDVTNPTVVKASPGTLYRVSVNTASSASVSACYDAITVSATNALGFTAANLIGLIPISGTGVLELEWPCQNGIGILPGAGANLSVSYE